MTPECIPEIEFVTSESKCEKCPEYSRAPTDVKHPTECEEPVCLIYQYITPEGFCENCPLFKGQTAGDRKSCSTPTYCRNNQKIGMRAECIDCEPHYLQNPIDPKQCQPANCEAKEKVLPNGSCGDCPDYEQGNL